MTTATIVDTAPRATLINRPQPYRQILITGSRYWRNEEKMRQALLEVWQPTTLLISGHAARGADRMAEQLWEGWGGLVARYPADWGRACDLDCDHGPRRFHVDGTSYCPRAGHVRNQRMVDLGAELCLAFFTVGGRNRGTMDCVERAEAAGIPVVRIKD